MPAIPEPALGGEKAAEVDLRECFRLSNPTNASSVTLRKGLYTEVFIRAHVKTKGIGKIPARYLADVRPADQ